MRISFPLKSLPTFFPDLADLQDDPDALEEKLTDFYTHGPIEPDVRVEGGSVTVDVDTASIEQFEDRYDRGVELAEQGRYDEARDVFEELLEEYPGVSDLHRMHAQTLFEEGRSEDALDRVISALRWDPENVHALTLTGNIFLQAKEDADTAKDYYDRAAEIAPDNHLVLNNLGGMMLKTGRPEEGKPYLRQALQANDEYPNTYYGLALAHKQEGDLLEGFEQAVEGLKCSSPRDQMHSRLANLTGEIAESYEERVDLSGIVEGYAQTLEGRAGKAIRLVEETGADDPATLRVAENYDRNEHRVVYAPSQDHRTHLIMHELVHLEFILEAREESWNELFVTGDEHRQAFINDHRKEIEKMKEVGLEGPQLEGMIDQLFSGLNNQVYNAPIDLFIEKLLYERFPKLRPVQYASLDNLLDTYVEGATNEMKDVAPRRVWASNVALNLTHAYQFRELFGIDREMEFKAPRQLRNRAGLLYDEYKEMEEVGRIPGEEYELIDEWAEKLNLEEYYDLIREDEHRDLRSNGSSEQASPETTNKEAEEVLDDIERDPYDLEEEAKRENEGTQISFEDNPSGSMAVTMHLVDAIDFYERKSKEEIQSVAFEIAMLGRQGLDPMNTDKRYSLKSVPNREFSPLQLLAYMFAGFQEIDDSVDTELGFEEEYERAQEMAGADK